MIPEMAKPRPGAGMVLLVVGLAPGGWLSMMGGEKRIASIENVTQQVFVAS